MKIGAIVLARLDSRRLPCKALRDLAGKPLIQWVFNAAQAVKGIDAVVLATSDRPSDDDLARYSQSVGIRVFRGSVGDVAKRFLDAMNAFAFDAALRLNGDSPFARPALLGQAVALFRDGGCDLVSNVPGRSFPFGLSAEVVSRDAMREADRVMPGDHPSREHVTKFFYDHPTLVRLKSIHAGEPGGSGLQLAVDEADDLARAAWIIAQLADRVADAPLEVLISLARQYRKALQAVS